MTSSLALAGQIGLVTAIIVVGVLVDRRLATTDPLVSVSRPVRILVVGGALGGPFALVNRNVLTGVFGIDELVVALGLALTLYVVAGRVVGVPIDSPGQASDNGHDHNHERPDD